MLTLIFHVKIFACRIKCKMCVFFNFPIEVCHTRWNTMHEKLGNLCLKVGKVQTGPEVISNSSVVAEC